MSEEVVACFRRILANRVAPKIEPMVDGYAGFLFLDKNDKPMVALHWEKYLEHIIEKYNKIYRIQMPKVTPHVCRHTFLFQYGEIRNESKDVAVYHGSFGHQRNAECLHPCAVRRRTGRAASSSKSLKHPVGTEHLFTNRFTNIAGKSTRKYGRFEKIPRKYRNRKMPKKPAILGI